ncbi:hypothetical protein [Nonlabens xiamenensis]|uniref:hypothetical protein n=1 Tax=Nonlabens xiamenensis TaxID=2341043 RepID=UPI0013DE0760|nr:hypothetical protein [Nonlabens xiamenensis]
MFKFLERVFGKPMRYYENLMESRKEHSNITAGQINEVKKLLEPCVLQATAFTPIAETPASIALKATAELPTDPKGNALPYWGRFKHNSTTWDFFAKPEKITPRQYENFSRLVPQIDDLSATISKDWEQKSVNSLPIWEEIIHRFPEIHREIVSLQPNHPWTLYRRAKKTIADLDYQFVLGGYPQWKVNNVDFRKIKDIEFIGEFKVPSTDYSLYYFKDPVNNVLDIKIQSF